MKQTLRGFNSTLRPVAFPRAKKRVDVSTEQMLLAFEGAHWKWPNAWMSEADWDGTLLDWAFKLGGCVKTWHCVTGDDSRSDPGWFDRVFLFEGKAILAELKVRDRKGVANRPSKKQWEFISAGINAGLDVRVWTWPDSAFEAWTVLTGLAQEVCPYWVETRPRP